MNDALVILRAQARWPALASIGCRHCFRRRIADRQARRGHARPHFRTRALSDGYPAAKSRRRPLGVDMRPSMIPFATPNAVVRFRHPYRIEFTNPTRAPSSPLLRVCAGRCSGQLVDANVKVLFHSRRIRTENACEEYRPEIHFSLAKPAYPLHENAIYGLPFRPALRLHIPKSCAKNKHPKVLKSLIPKMNFGGVDGARTRDPRRDRPVF